MLKLLKKLVEIESPSHSKRAVDRLGRFLAAEFRRRGAKVSFLRSKEYGDCLRAEFHGNLSGKNSIASALQAICIPTESPGGTES